MRPAEQTSARTLADAPSAKREAEKTRVTNPEEAMQLLEARRAWTFAVGLGVLGAITFVVVWFLGGDPLAQRVHLIGLGGTTIAMLLYALVRRNPAHFRSIELLLLLVVAVAANATAYIYWGVLSGYLGVIAATGYAFA